MSSRNSEILLIFQIEVTNMSYLTIGPLVRPDYAIGRQRCSYIGPPL